MANEVSYGYFERPLKIGFVVTLRTHLGWSLKKGFVVMLRTLSALRGTSRKDEITKRHQDNEKN